jgi:superfamily I DNA/RNA helicase
MRLPTYQELSKEQLKIHSLPLDGTYLVSGPPGTGKTVMALYRAKMYEDYEKRPKLVMYNNTLKDYTSNATEDLGIRESVTTFHSWFWNSYPEWTDGSRAPEEERFVYDWPEVMSDLIRADIPNKPLLLIDEGQDLPPGFYDAIRLLSDGCTVFADENQRISEENSTLKEIRSNMRIDGEDEMELTRNYRNTDEIAQLARHFFVGLPTGVADLPDRKGSKPVVKRTRNAENAAEYIARYERTNSHQKIGVFVPYIGVLDDLYSDLSELDTANEVRFYSSKQRDESNMDFAQNGIHVLCYASAKGLEFDAVFMPELQRYKPDMERAEAKMQMYVLLSRAREELFLLYSGEEPPLLDHFPDELIERRQ